MTAKDIETFTRRSHLTPRAFVSRLAIAALLVAAGYVIGRAAEDTTTIAQVTPAVPITSGDATAVRDQALAEQVVVTSNADAIGFHDRVLASDESYGLTDLGRAILLKDAIHGGDQAGLP